MDSEKRYCTILIKRRVAGPPGPPETLVPGELAMNEGNNVLYAGTTQNTSASGIDLGFF